ncbi:MAG: hypothetical protein UY16_C0008G0019 [Candidatus Gottesmanbacteria bacterium GW2011_GWA2_47_9]|uniref:DUF2188 domain-containing protein n=1 Tax=Candidatus Gottesmanbacteria bacterium GW2011_GWA2_47_9 TaxID=1618445 RepID=A0A0G1U2P9_9BACT|nr:MAG: hypothetical protein UY16_C0008G0019 [Candidatus Gottesmanbacteria bacterium GW2011_GWA2_47_9]
MYRKEYDVANYNVVKGQNGGWNVKRDNAERASAHTDTQQEAEKEAKQFSSNSGGGEVRIHGLDGKIRDSDTVPPAHDPYPPKDNRH